MHSFEKYINFFLHINPNLQRRIFVLIPLLSLAGVLEIVSLAILIPLISLVLESESNFFIIELLNVDNLSSTRKVLIIFLVFMSLVIFKNFFVFYTTQFTYFTSALIKSSFQNKLLLSYLEKDYFFHLQSNSAHYLRNITVECNHIEGRLIMPSLSLIAEVLPIFFILSFLAYLNPAGVAIAFLVFTLTGVSILKFTSNQLVLYGREQIRSDGMQVKVAKEAFSVLREISIYHKSDKISKIYNKYTKKSAELVSRALILGQTPKLVLEIVGLFTVALIAFVSFLNGATGDEVLVELAVFMGAIIKILPSANKVVMNLQSLTHAKPAVENILKELKQADISKKADGMLKLSTFEKLGLENVCFKYPNTGKIILESINLNVTRGEIVGIRGESGSGKSTLINLLLGLLDTTEGHISINGMNISQCKESWQKKIGYVPQEVVLFDDTLKNNITFYQDNISKDEIDELLRRLKLGEFVDCLHNTVGESGSSLSGGQKQRVGIARALIRKPEFIIFDEATSALDSETEQDINRLIKEISKTVTVFVIAHKSSALEVCDRVYTIKNRDLVQWES